MKVGEMRGKKWKIKKTITQRWIDKETQSEKNEKIGGNKGGREENRKKESQKSDKKK